MHIIERTAGGLPAEHRHRTYGSRGCWVTCSPLPMKVSLLANDSKSGQKEASMAFILRFFLRSLYFQFKNGRRHQVSQDFQRSIACFIQLWPNDYIGSSLAAQ